jgi:large subunit ribosomal protein L30
MAKASTLKVRLIHSTIGEKPKTRAAVRSLGLRKIDQVRELRDSPSVRGQIARVAHLVEVEES